MYMDFPVQILSMFIPRYLTYFVLLSLFLQNLSLKLSQVSQGLCLVLRSIRPSGLRRCNQSWNVPGSNPFRHSAGLRDEAPVTFGSKIQKCSD